MGQYDWVPPTEETQQPEAVVELWPAGNYEGTLKGGTLVSSQIKGTPGFEFKFDVNGHEKIVTVWISDAGAEIAIGQLKVLGWNGDMGKPEFEASGPVSLYMKHDTYKGKTKEQWMVSTFERKAAPSASDPALARFAARFKSMAKAPPPPPPGKPSLASDASKPAPKPPAPKAPPKPPAPKPKPKASTMEEAWQVWLDAKCEDGELFYKQVEKTAGTTDTENVTAAQWADIAAAAPPF